MWKSESSKSKKVGCSVQETGRWSDIVRRSCGDNNNEARCGPCTLAPPPNLQFGSGLGLGDDATRLHAIRNSWNPVCLPVHLPRYIDFVTWPHSFPFLRRSHSYTLNRIILLTKISTKSRIVTFTANVTASAATISLGCRCDRAS